ncbi:MAG: hypothetical protein M1840_009181 [Geoglossum simile]|nr:MAG: hypothetical protein M1840_009181 [Geoglossum simile]
MEPSTGLPPSTALSAQPTSRELYAFCKLCPPSAEAQLFSFRTGELERLGEQCRAAADAWLGRDRTYDVMQDVPSLTMRDSGLPVKAKLRDGACLITDEGLKGSEVTHILPYSVGKSQSRASMDLWTVVRIFWGEDPTTQIQNLIFGPPTNTTPNSRTLVNELYNVITISSQAHSYWGQGFFALEPHPEDDVEDRYMQRAIFRWVYPHVLSRKAPGVFAPIALTDNIPAQSNDMDGAGGKVGLFSYSLGRLVQDGDIVTFRTNDPVRRPLPNRELLWLQYSMILVLRMAGRAGWDMWEMNDSGSDVDSVGGEEGETVEMSDIPAISTETRVSPSYQNRHPLTAASLDANGPAPLPPASSTITTETTSTDKVKGQPHFLPRLISRVKGWARTQPKSLGMRSTRSGSFRREK